MNHLRLKLYSYFPKTFSGGIKKLINEYHKKKGMVGEISKMEEITTLERLLMQGASEKLVTVLESNNCKLNFQNYTPREILFHKEIVNYVIDKDFSQIVYLPDDMITDEYLERYANSLKRFSSFSDIEIPKSRKLRDIFFEVFEKNVFLGNFFDFLEENLMDEELVGRLIEIGERKGYFKVDWDKVSSKLRVNKDVVRCFVANDIRNIEYVTDDFFDYVSDVVADKILKGDITRESLYKISNPIFWSSSKILKAILNSSDNLLLEFVSKFDIVLFSDQDIADLCIREYNYLGHKDCFPDGYQSNPRFLKAVFEQEYFRKVEYFDESAYTEENKEILKQKLKKEDFGWVGNFYKYSSVLRQDPTFVHLYLEKVNEFVDSYLGLKNGNQFMFRFVLSSIQKFSLDSFSDDDFEFFCTILEKYSFDGELKFHRDFLSSEVVLSKFIDYQIFDYVDVFDEEVFTANMINKLYFNMPFDKFKNLNFVKEHYDFVYQELVFDSENLLEERFHSIDSIASAMILIRKYMESDFKSESLDHLKNETLIYVSQKLSEISVDKNSIEILIQKVLDGRLNSFWLDCLENEKQLYVMAHFDVELNMNIMEYIQTVPNEVVHKVNKKHLNQIIRLLYDHHISNANVLHLAINMYLSIGLSRSRDLLSMNPNKNYGSISENTLKCIFSRINPIHVLFEEVGNGYLPVYNEQWIHLIFGENYRIKNTPIRNYLGNLKDKVEEFEQLKQRVSEDLSLIQSDKDVKISILEKQFHQYDKDLYEFFSLCGKSFNEWDIIEEEFFKIESKSKLKVKLNIPKIIEILKLIESKRRMPELEPRDDILLKTDVFDYVGYDTQFTMAPEKAPMRAVELSRKMEGVLKKKFPNICIQKNGYMLKVYEPQDRRILSAGYRNKNCFRPNGNADDFGKDSSLLCYCATTEYGGGVEICDQEGKTVMFSPILRNGNVLMIHSVESGHWDSEKSDIVHELLEEYANKCIEMSSDVGDDISFVTVTNSYYLDKKYKKLFLPDDRRFYVYDENGNFEGMYHNLDHSHVVFASKEGKTFQDICYGKVDYSYEYPVDKKDLFFHFSMSEEERNFIQNMNQIKDSIISMSNARLEYLQQGNEMMSYELLRKIREGKREYLSKYKVLLSNGNGRDIFDEYQKASKTIRYVDKELGINSNMDMAEVTYGNDWYVMCDSQKNIVSNCLESGSKKLTAYLKEMRQYSSVADVSMVESKYIK